MKKQTLQNVQYWLRKYRPELESKEVEALSNKVLMEIYPEVENLSSQAGVIFVNSHLQENYYYSAYNLVKSVFEEEMQAEFLNYSNSPIFSEVNMEILDEAVKNGIFNFRGETLGVQKFTDKKLAESVFGIIKKAVA